jgi:hypothetical protein
MVLLNTTIDTFNGMGLPQGGGSNPIEFKLKVHNNYDLNMVECSTSTFGNCVIKYNKDYTADLLDVTPCNVYKDQLIQLQINGKSVSSATPASGSPIREIRIGGTLVDWLDLITDDKRLASWTHDTFNVRVGD